MPGSGLGLLATDLDGTLLRGDATVSARTVETLGRVTRGGVPHVIVTGRPAGGCEPFFRALDYRGLAVCGQGAQIYDADRGVLLSGATLDRRGARAFVRRLTERIGPLRLAVVTSGLSAEFVVSAGFARGDEHVLAPFRAVRDTDELWSRPVDKVLLRHPELSDADVLAAAASCLSPDLTVTHAGPGMVEVLPAGVDKARGLAVVARTLGVGRAEVVAFGDMPNDVPMLEWAGHAVAMANGHPELKAVADEIAPTNDEDGVAVVVDRLLGEKGALACASTC
ncbi:HAD family hydrolase [Streptomyces sp. NPDC059629]|uniref:HAD family hydrolase n=1 Tax=Streptomyces sp. NPDC059629 TaxID=3346889 RepID=UPI0036D0F670